MTAASALRLHPKKKAPRVRDAARKQQRKGALAAFFLSPRRGDSGVGVSPQTPPRASPLPRFRFAALVARSSVRVRSPCRESARGSAPRATTRARDGAVDGHVPDNDGVRVLEESARTRARRRSTCCSARTRSTASSPSSPASRSAFASSPTSGSPPRTARVKNEFHRATSMDPRFFDYHRPARLARRCAARARAARGSVAFPRVPLMRVEGPLIVVQLVETTLLNLVNYASLVATNAARHRLVAGPGVQLLEFGLRWRAGPRRGGLGVEVRLRRRVRRHVQPRGRTTVRHPGQGHARALVRPGARGVGRPGGERVERRRRKRTRFTARARERGPEFALRGFQAARPGVRDKLRGRAVRARVVWCRR